MVDAMMMVKLFRRGVSLGAILHISPSLLKPPTCDKVSALCRGAATAYE